MLCLGHQWVLWFCLDGHYPAPNNSVAVYLASNSNKRINIEFDFSVKDI
jgi:hypothetical protein